MKRGIVFLILTIVFTVVAFGLFIGIVQPESELRNISNNGTASKAVVIDADSNTTVNDSYRYRLIFEFVNDDGQTIRAETEDVYTDYELDDMGLIEIDPNKPDYWRTIPGVEIDIKYSGEKAVVIPYKAGIGGIVGLVFTIVLGVLAVVMLILAIFGFRKGAISGRVRAVGHDGMATYLEHTTNLTVNGSPRYKIKYSYTDENGILVEGKTGSKYSWYEAEAFASIRSFPIKFLGSKSVVMLDRKDLLIEKQRELGQYQEKYPPTQTYGEQNPYQTFEDNQSGIKHCRQCGLEITSDTKFCSGCGAKNT